MNASALKEFSSDILKNIVSRALGEAKDLQNSDYIDWDYAKVRTHPVIHSQEDQRLADLNENGETIDKMQWIQHTLNKIGTPNEFEGSSNPENPTKFH